MSSLGASSLEPAVGATATLTITGASDTDASLAGQVVTATATGLIGTITYTWTAVNPSSGATVTGVFSSTSVQAPTFTPSEPGTWALTCEAEDEVGTTVTATITTRRGYLLAAVPWITVDLTDGTWPTSDPDSFQGTAVSVAAGIHTFTAGAHTADEKWSLTNTSTFTGARWSKALVDAAGVAITSDDHAVVLFELDDEGTTQKGPLAVYFGIAEAPASTSTATIKATGFRSAHANSIGSLIAGAFSLTTATDLSANDSNRIILGILYLRPGGMPDAHANILDATGQHRDSRTQADAGTFTASTALSLLIGFGAYNASVATVSGDNDKKRFRYKVLRMSPTPNVS